MSAPPGGAGLARQRMVKSGNFATRSAGAGGMQLVPSWSSDAAAPATISSNKLVVAGAMVGATVRATVEVSDGNPGRLSCRLMVDGVQVAAAEQPTTSSSTPVSLSATVNLTAGALVHLEAYSITLSSFQERTIKATTTFLEVAPV
ncbi:hypothetical protein [Gordonia malaquae]|uniref:hypothetical protein n=1 Tax=Gordonia malaquae TaxID=410332 RepID=UPI003016FF1C